MVQQRFARGGGYAGCVLLLAITLVAIAAAGSWRPAQAQDVSPTLAAQTNYLYLPLLGKTPKLIAPFPPPGATNQSPNVYLAWQLGDALTPDPRYTILLAAGDDTPDVAIAQNLTATAFEPPTFANDTVYYWQVVVYGSNGETQFGPVWSFRTEPWYDPPPVGTMVDVPAGWFTMGCDMNNHGFGDGCNDKDMPLHSVWLSAYAIDKYEVTNVEYRACVKAGACSLPRKNNSHSRGDYFKNYQV